MNSLTEFRFVIDPTGRVTEATALHSNAPDPSTALCIARAVRLWSFPPHEGASTTVVYKFQMCGVDES